MNNNTNLANREVCDLVFCDYETQKPFLNVDFANTTTAEITGESVFAYGGKGHPKRVVFHGEKGGTIAFETQIQTMKLYSLLSGAAIESSAKFIRREEAVCAAAGKLTVKKQPVSGTIYVYPAEDDCGQALRGTFAAAAASGENAGWEITFTAGSGSSDSITAGSKYVVYYIEELSSGVQKISIKSTTFPKSFTVYGDTYDKTEHDEIIGYRLIAYKCAPQSNFTLSFANSGDPATMTITCDLMADKDNHLLDLIMIEA